MKQIVVCLLLLLTTLGSNPSPSFAITESLPEAIVAGSVNVITGDHYFIENDIVIQGAFPLKIPRSYISSSKSWKHFPHFFAYLDTEYYRDCESQDHDIPLWFIQITEANGTVLTFEADPHAIRKKKQPIMFHLQADRFNQGLTNTAKGEISGKTNLKNVRIEMESGKQSFLFYAPDGTVRYYQKIKSKNLEKTYLLQWERMPNQSLMCYGHDEQNRLNTIRVANHSNTKTFASATIVYHSDKPHQNPNYDIHTSDGRVLNYRFEILSDFSLLTNANTPDYPQEFISYHKVKYGSGTWGYLLGHRDISCHRHYNVDYYFQGHHQVGGKDIKIKTDHPKWLRVKTLSSPVGQDQTSHITHTFTYDTDNRITYVREIDQTLTEYRYSPSFRLEHILYYGEKDQLHHSEKYIWGTEGALATNLICHTFLDHQHTPLFSKKFFYDNYGNIIEEKLYSNLSSKSSAPLSVSKEGMPQENGVETYSIKRSYSQDGLNLLIREEAQNGKVTLNNYHPNTAVLVSQFICDHTTIKIRHFYDYNEDFLLVREIIDDGSSSDKYNLSDVKTRLIKEVEFVPNGHPYQGMPHTITEKYWDGATETLLKRTTLTYTTGGCIDKQDIYDSHNTYCYNLTAKYDLAGRVLEETNPIGQQALYSYDPIGNQILHKEFSSQKENHKSYDFSNRLTGLTEKGIDGLKRTTTHTYDGKHNRITTQDPYGHETRFEPDPFGQIIKIHHPPISSPTGSFLYPIETQNYDSLGRQTLTVNARGHEIHQTFNARNQVVFIKHPDEGFETFIYNLDGTLSSHTNQEGATTTYTYDFLGRKTSETNALGHTTTYTYDAFNLISTQNAEGIVTTHSYDGAGRKIREDLAGEITDYLYDNLGRLYCTKKGDACHITIYDFLDRVIEERDEDIHQNVYKKINYTYDEAGNRSSIIYNIDGKEAPEYFCYDSFNRLIEHKDALGYLTTTHYDDNYQNAQKQIVLQTTTTDPLGLETITTYDVSGHIASIQKRKSGKILDSEELFYDENKNLTYHLKNQLQKTEWSYDSMNHIETLTEAESKITHYTYTKTGLLLNKCKPDGTLISNQYDLLGLLSETVSSDSSIKYTFTYNKIGQPTEEKNELDGTKTTRKFDPQGRVIQETLGNGLSLSSDYDEQGRKQRLILPDQSEILFHYDPIFLRKIIRHQESHHFNQYDLSGNLLKQTFMGSLGPMHISYTLTGLKQSFSSQFGKQEAIFDAACNLSELITNNHLKTYTYDDLYRLTQEEGYEYKYDPNGNRIYKNQEEFHYNNINELTSQQTSDPNGNPSEDNQTLYTYDALDRLISLQNPNQTIQLRYDYQGRLLSKTLNNTSTFFIYDDFKEIGTTDASGNILQLRVLNPTFISERGAAVLLELNHKPYIPLHDLFGNVISLFDLQGRPIETYNYSAFGEGLSPTLNPWVYASKRSFPSDEGLIFFGKRFYNPKYGRWLTPDPAGFLDDYNLYSFVANNPLTNFDHYGLLAAPFMLSAQDLQKNDRKYFDPILDAETNLSATASKYLLSSQSDTKSAVLGASHGTAEFGLSNYQDLHKALVVIGSDDLPVNEKISLISNLDKSQTNQISKLENWMTDLFNIDPFDTTYHSYRFGTRLGLEVGALACSIYGVGREILAINKLARISIETAGFLHQAKQPTLSRVEKIIEKLEMFLGKDSILFKNRYGDLLIESKDGLRQFRMDFNFPKPHKNPHAHLIQYETRKNKKFEITNHRIYPIDVKPE